MRIKIEFQKLKDFYLLQAGQFASQLGSGMSSFCFVLWVYREGGSVLSASLLYICSLVPSVGLSFLAGGISDRWNKKKIMLISDTIAAAFSLSVFIMLFAGVLKIEYLYVINVFLGIAAAFQGPAAEVAVSLTVPKESLMQTSGFRSFCRSFLDVFTPIAATAVFAFGGLKTVVLFDLLTFVLSVLTLTLCVVIPEVEPDEKNDRESVWGSCRQGIQYIRRHRGIFALVGLMFFINFIVAIYYCSLAPMVLRRNGNHEFQLGIVTGAVGVAGLAGSFLVKVKAHTKKRVPLILGIIASSFLVCNTMLGVGRNYYVWTLAIFLGNLMIPVFSANVDYLMRTKVPIAMQGRVFSARITMQYISIPIGYTLGGMLTDRFFEPFMSKSAPLQAALSFFVGRGPGSGIGLLYICLAAAGFLGCLFFWMNKNLRSLDEE